MPAAALATTGTTLTATEYNYLPRGVLAKQTLTTNFATSATHTTMQDSGFSQSVAYEANRILRVTCHAHYYASGGAQGVNVRFVYGATPTVIGQISLSAHVMNNTAAVGFAHVMYMTTPGTAGTATFKVQISAATSNTAVNQYGDATLPRFFMVEDCGPA